MQGSGLSQYGGEQAWLVCRVLWLAVSLVLGLVGMEGIGLSQYEEYQKVCRESGLVGMQGIRV